MPDVHPHAFKGAIVSLAMMWRLRVVHARDPEDALWVLRSLAHPDRQNGIRRSEAIPPKAEAPGIEEDLHASDCQASVQRWRDRLLLHFGMVERVITADEITLRQVPGLGRTKARQIREIVS
jgi:ERCC4-type nuclease